MDLGIARGRLCYEEIMDTVRTILLGQCDTGSCGHGILLACECVFFGRDQSLLGAYAGIKAI